MKCPNCGEEVEELEQNCPKCKINFEDFEKNQKRLLEEHNEENASKTTFLKTINVLQIVSCGIGTLVAWSNEKVLEGFLLIIISIVVFAFIKGFYDIIDLLDSINDKLDK